MGKGASNLPPEKPKLAGIEEDATADNTEAVALPLCAGYCRGALTWIMEPVNQYTQPAPSSGGKK